MTCRLHVLVPGISDYTGDYIGDEIMAIRIIIQTVADFKVNICISLFCYGQDPVTNSFDRLCFIARYRISFTASFLIHRW